MSAYILLFAKWWK